VTKTLTDLGGTAHETAVGPETEVTNMISAVIEIPEPGEMTPAIATAGGQMILLM
jgi:hypothetical protein